MKKILLTILAVVMLILGAFCICVEAQSFVELLFPVIGIILMFAGGYLTFKLYPEKFNDKTFDE